MTIKILVADDSVTIQKMISLAFSDEAAVVEPASDGDSALERLRLFRPDIVLADVCMPGSNGYEVCERIKESAEFGNIPVVLLAGTFEPYDEQEAARVRCDGHLTKPFDTTELIELVHTLTGNNHPLYEEKGSDGEPDTAGFAPATVVSGIGAVIRNSAVAPRAWDSFTGPERILELFDRQTLAAAAGVTVAVSGAVNAPGATETAGPPVDDSLELSLSDELLERIVDMAVRRMSTDVIREVAWEVVPELSEVLVRRVVEEQNKARSDHRDDTSY